jgi:hypothetical protein
MTAIQVSTVSSLFDLAADLNTVIEQAMATTPGGAPDRSYVSLGQPAWDTMCSYAVTQVPVLAEGQTAPTSPAEATGLRYLRGRVNLATLTGYAIRCIQVSDGNQQPYSAPSDAQLTADARQAYEDGWAIWNLLTRLAVDGELFQAPCGIIHFDGGQAVAPAGALGGWQFTLRVEVPGYDPRAT